MKAFLIKSTILTIIIFVLGTILYSTVLKPYFIPVLPFAVLFFLLITNLVHAYLLKIAGKAGSRFTSQYMAVSFIKMFFYLAVAIVFVVLNHEQAKPFLLNFLVLYVVYTFLEVYEFSNIVKQKGS
jgi:phosphotransferase system  glucose/maltose/N-acetylglucosamine-specific IIC component